MASGSTLCGMCGEHTAQLFCACTVPETFLCAQCVGAHNDRRTGCPHASWPMNQLAHYRAPGYSEQVQERLEQFPHVRAQMLGQVSAVDRALQEFSEAMDRTIEELTRYRNKTVGELQGVRAELSTEVEIALAEVERTLVEDRPQLTSKYGHLVRALTEAMRSIELFSYSFDPPPPIQIFHCKLNTYQRASDKFASYYLGGLALFDLNTQEISRHSLGVDNDWPGYIALEGNILMLVGLKVMTVDLLTFQVTTLRNLLTPRECPGVAKVGKVVFAFGGLDKDRIRGLTVCEKWSMQHWSPLGDMHYARGCFTPCHFQSLIYLAAAIAKDHRAVESFSPHTEIFTVLPVSLPQQLKLGLASVAFVANGELCLLADQLACWAIQPRSEFRLSAVETFSFSCQQPLIVGTEVFIACYGYTEVAKWSIETRQFVYPEDPGVT